uniref:Uncharacterized protein n=1 Tax=Pipistrellus kuhlii TaxID=59472 RepID=A0A7J7V0R9_PIPKU|nr:hypothetical protein mPipKuh1_008648 [Pipistrellus kuhlii]
MSLSMEKPLSLLSTSDPVHGICALGEESIPQPGLCPVTVWESHYPSPQKDRPHPPTRSSSMDCPKEAGQSWGIPANPGLNRDGGLWTPRGRPAAKAFPCVHLPNLHLGHTPVPSAARPCLFTPAVPSAC